MRQFFFATREDFLQLFSAIAVSGERLTFREVVYPGEICWKRRYKDARDLPDLGGCPTRKLSQQRQFDLCRRLLTFDESKLALRLLLHRIVDPDSALTSRCVLLRAGGVYANEAVIGSEMIGNRDSRSLYRAIRSTMKELFWKSPDAFVGFEALQLAEAGYRLTDDIGRPSEYDWSLSRLNSAQFVMRLRE